MAKPRLLEDIRITDLSTVVFGPYCTQVLADLGAEVVKIEPTDGDLFRRVGVPNRTPGMGPGHIRLNRNKRSVVWDLKSGKGREAMRRLLAKSDVLVHNIRADAAARVGLDYETVSAIKPDIIYVHCVGFGSEGPYGGLQAYDDLIQAASGIASLLPRVDGVPQPRFLPTLIADKISGLHALYATLAAIVHRLRTGEGQFVEVPMLESFTDFVLLEHLAGLTFVPPNAPACYSRQIDPSRQPVRTKDGYISITPYNDERWQRFFAAAGHEDVLNDRRLATPELRLANIQMLYTRLAEVALERTTEEWMDLLKVVGIPAMRYNAIEDLMADPHLAETGFFTQRTHPTEGEYLEVRAPVKFSARPYPAAKHAPALGEHTNDVLAELGLSPD